MLNIQEKPDGITIECYISPRASKSKIKGERNGALAIALRSAPVEGKANQELIEFLAKLLSVPKSKISILRGETSRTKLVFIQGIKKNIITAKIN
ncbi:MAG: DUF167 domain-containing protein [Pseudomonadota bacterium]